MDIKLFLQAIIKYVFGVLIVGGLLFIPANSFEYWNGWLFMGLLFIPMFEQDMGARRTSLERRNLRHKSCNPNCHERA